MATEKKLISYNTEKHPEVSDFFEELEDTNLTSHYVREAIKFYKKYKNTTPATEPIRSQVLDNHSSNLIESNEKVKKESENEYLDFNPNEIFDS